MLAMTGISRASRGRPGRAGRDQGGRYPLSAESWGACPALRTPIGPLNSLLLNSLLTALLKPETEPTHLIPFSGPDP